MSPALARSIEASGLDATGSTADSALSPGHMRDGARTVEALGRTLAQLHASPVSLDDTAAFAGEPTGAARPAQLVRQAQASVRDASAGVGTTDDATRSGAYRHMTPQALVDVLSQGVESVSRSSTPMVLTHGRPTLDRLMVDRGRPVGFIDWEQADLSHPERDLAAAARSVVEVFGVAAVPALFESYGSRPDPFRLDWFSLAVELVP